MFEPAGTMHAPDRHVDVCFNRRMRARPISRRVIAMVVVAVAAAGGLAFANAGDRATDRPIVPHFVDDTAASGIDHRYEGEFQFFVGGGVAAFDCDDDGLPDLYFAGGSGPAALYRNESRPRARFASRRSRRPPPTSPASPVPTRSTSTATATSTSPSCGSGRTSSCAGTATASSSTPTSGGASTAETRGPTHSARHGKGRTPCRRWRSATTWPRMVSRARTAGCSGLTPAATHRRWRSHPATARCPSCSATGSAPDGAICA